jgi:hypothetical protein
MDGAPRCQYLWAGTIRDCAIERMIMQVYGEYRGKEFF